MQKTKKITRGFTLVEMLLYIVIVATVLLGVFAFMNVLVRSRVKITTVMEVEQQGIFISEILSQDIRNAISIDNVSANGLSMTETSGTISIGFEDGKIVRSDNSGTASLTSPRVIASEFSVTNLASVGPPSVRISFTLSHANLSHRTEYDYSRAFATTATLRNR